jgi:hypothetical protein
MFCVFAAMLGMAALWDGAGAAELAPLPKLTAPRIYVFDCGTLVYNKPEDSPVPCSSAAPVRAMPFGMPRRAVILSGDLYHYPEERTLQRMPDSEKTTGTVESRQKVEELSRRTGAQLWIGHSMEFFRTVRKSPSWYD